MADDFELALSSGIAAFEAKQFTKAMQLLSPLAEQGVPDAQYRVAIMQQNGLGVVRNELQAVRWMRAAAERGHALAQHGLGRKDLGTRPAADLSGGPERPRAGSSRIGDR